MSLFEDAWKRTGAVEGGYTNNPNDKGGPTNHGITEVVARAHGYAGDMKDLPLSTAVAIAKAQYWDILGLDDIGSYSAPIANELFDTGYLSGYGVAGLFLQKALNLFNRGAKDYPDIAEDGHPGKVTAAALAKFLALRGTDGEKVMLRCLNCQQGALFLSIGRSTPQDEDFEFGWYLNRVVI